jgi:hypothetical protein
MPEGVSDLAIGVEIGDEPDIVWVLAIVLAILCGASLLCMRRRPSEGAV